MNQEILIVEDEPSIADTLVFAIKNNGMTPTRVATLTEARQCLSENCYAAIILDVGLPDGSGFDFCKEIRQTLQTPVLFLTARSDEIDRVVGLEIGADDYITKPFSPRELVARVKAILRRTQDTSPQASPSAPQLFSIDKNKRQVSFKNQNLELSRYEYGTLELLLSQSERVFSRQQIMDHVWESPDMSLERTVDTHIKTIRQKLKKLDGDALLITHRGVGYSIKNS